MTLPGHFIIGILLYFILPYPFNWVVISFSHFPADKYPDFWSKKDKYLKEWKWNLLFLLGIIFNYFLSMFVFYNFFNLSLKQLIFITLLTMFPDISEVLYVFIKSIFDKKNTWREKFWFNHEGFFPFKVNNWQYSTSTFKCLSRGLTILFDFGMFLIVLFIVFLIS